MKPTVVEVSDYAVVTDPEGTLVTHSLGSCIAVVLHDPVRLVGGMLHYQLPLSSMAPERARECPAMFADTGVPLLFAGMYAQGCRKEDLVVTVAGGSSVRGREDMFAIGERNYAVLLRMFARNAVSIAAEDVGGFHPRTVRLAVGTGKVTVRIGGSGAAAELA